MRLSEKADIQEGKKRFYSRASPFNIEITYLFGRIDINQPELTFEKHNVIPFMFHICNTMFYVI